MPLPLIKGGWEGFQIEEREMSIDSSYFKSIVQDLVYDLERTFPYASVLALDPAITRCSEPGSDQTAVIDKVPCHGAGGRRAQLNR